MKKFNISKEQQKELISLLKECDFFNKYNKIEFNFHSQIDFYVNYFDNRQ